MSLTQGAFDIRAEHPKRIHVDRQMQEIRVKKTARDQLPHLESYGSFQLWYGKMADRPEREARHQTRPGYRFKGENGDVYADQQSCESRHNASNRVYLFSRKDHEGSRPTQLWKNSSTKIGEQENRPVLSAF